MDIAAVTRPPHGGASCQPVQGGGAEHERSQAYFTRAAWGFLPMAAYDPMSPDIYGGVTDAQTDDLSLITACGNGPARRGSAFCRRSLGALNCLVVADEIVMRHCSLSWAQSDPQLERRPADLAEDPLGSQTIRCMARCASPLQTRKLAKSLFSTGMMAGRTKPRLSQTVSALALPGIYSSVTVHS